MSDLQFSIFFCGMSEETFSEHIMIYKPNSSIVNNFTESDLRELGLTKASKLIDFLKNDANIRERLGTWGLDNFSVDTIYVRHNDYLLGLREDKLISDMFSDFQTQNLELSYFVVGGASFHNETSYRFTIHPDEKIHQDMPHVHVSKAGVEIRYSLEDLLPIDRLINPHKRDNRKIITPFLQSNRQKLLELWNYYNKGYTIPEVTQEGQQFYKES